ncbi:hypothetical protein [Paenibacillus sp. FSL R5-0473]|uniref:hypothetical protein n=1 Tax=Paenibacillus sp. FSL R5-0473 TaxID=2921642 RepID=UPI0030F68756
MLEQLIIDGEALEGETQGKSGNVSLSEEFEKWAFLSAEILDTKFQSQMVRHEADVAFKTRKTNPDSKRKTILGCLRALKEIQDTENSFASKIWALNKKTY